MSDYTPKSFKLDPKVAETLERLAKREDRSQTAIVERAIRAYDAASETPAQPIADAPAPTPTAA